MKDIYMRGSSKELLPKVDAVVFDCDGVLIDARRSYDATIRVVVETMVEEITGVKLRLENAVPRLISTVRRTGGFNSDWDTSYALTMFATVALEGKKERRGATEALMSIAESFGSSAEGRGQEAVDTFLEKEFPSMRGSLERARRHTGYPETPPEGRLTTVFDELYFGADLYRKVHGTAPGSGRERGLIELERPLVHARTLDLLSRRLGDSSMGIVTGRPFVGTQHSLGKRMMGYFDRDASIFIGDADVDPSLRPEYDRYRKPNPDALVRAKERLSSDVLLYVGDSAEDLLMVKKLKEQGERGYLFAGVYQTSPVQADQAAFFEREGSDMVLETVNQAPSGLLLPAAEEARDR